MQNLSYEKLFIDLKFGDQIALIINILKVYRGSHAIHI